MQADVTSAIQTYLHVSALDVERARRIILAHLASLGEWAEAKSEEYGGLEWLIQSKLYSEPVNLPAGIARLIPNPNETKAKLVAREALQSLLAMGAVLPLGGQVSRNDEFSFSYATERSSGDPTSVKGRFPVVQYSYRLAASFRGDGRFRLLSTDLYLSDIQVEYLPSRAKRCLDESLDAFRQGLYLSAVMNVGAASENIWMELARLIEKKAATPGLSKALAAKRTFISTVIDEAWIALESHCSTELDTVFQLSAQRSDFKERADRLREHRNYAAHVGDASNDEHYFTYEETGMLLLEATRYFDRLVALYTQFAAIP